MDAEQANREYEEFIDSLFGAPVVLVREIFNGTIRCFSDGRVERLLKGGNWKEVAHTPNCDGGKYNSIEINGKKYKRSRLIAFAFLGLEDPDGDICPLIADHISGDKLDDSISNLRVITQAKNCLNTNSKCYTWRKDCQKWKVQLYINNKNKHFGNFANEADAAARALELKLIHYPEFIPRHAYNLANGL